MSNQNYKIVYSLRMHLEFQRLGFKCLMEMKNPQKAQYNCWVYERTPEFMKKFDELIRGYHNGR